MLRESQQAEQQVREQTRRHFFGQCGVGLGSIALASLLGEQAGATSGRERLTNPLAVQPTHYPAKIKSVIFLFMAGAPSQLELFDYKPKLQELNGEVVPESYVKNKRFAFIGRDAKLLGTRRKFARHGQSGAVVSELLPHIASAADALCFIHSMTTDAINHGPAKLFVNTGSPQFSGRPSMGSWITYGIGSESRNLPGFIVLQSGPGGPRGGAALWSSGFLPSAYQGVPLRSGPEPILNLTSPPGYSLARQRRFYDAVRDLNTERLQAVGDPEISARIAQYEMAYRMQTSAPELMELAAETPQTLAMYGAEPGKPSFANNCLLARRLVERGVRFVQLYHKEWDHHGNIETNLGAPLDKICREVDQPSAALVKDLKQRGLLDETLIIWGGEFGRTPMGEPRELIGRDHHIDGYTMWLAGGGIKPGYSLGETDELGFYAVENRVHVHDLQATILHLLGLDHRRLTYRFQGRNFRLTDVRGELIRDILA